jgi:hypothetical protein
MHDYMPELDGPQSYRTRSGPSICGGEKMILCKGGKKGGKSGGLGSILSIAASIAIPFAAPALAGAMGIGGVVGSSVVGAGLGAVSATVTGGDPLKGALMGGIGGGIGGWAQGGSGMGSISGAEGAAGFVGPPSSMAGNFMGPSEMLAGSGGFGSFGAESAFVGPPSSLASDFVGPSEMLAGSNGIVGDVAAGNLVPYGQTTPDMIAGPEYTATESMVNGAKAGIYDLGQGVKDSFAEALNPKNLGKAGLQFGGNMLASELTGQGDAMEAYTDSLKAQQQMNQEAWDFNKGQMAKKNGIGDQLQQDALSYDPAYFASQSANSYGIAADNAWGDTERRMRAQGQDENAINAEKSRYGLEAGLKKSSAYDQGWQRGLGAQTSTRTAAGGMYETLQAGSANASDMAAYFANTRSDAKALGDTINTAFGGTSADKMAEQERKKLAQTQPQP